MARRARIILSGVPQHIIQRGNNRQATFFAEEHYRCYLDWLLEAVKKYDWPLGGERFKDEIESALKCATYPPKRGRPARSVMPIERGEPLG